MSDRTSRVLAILQTILGLVLFVFGIVDLAVQFSASFYVINFGIALGIWVSKKLAGCSSKTE